MVEATTSLRVRVANKTLEADDVCSFELRPVGTGRLPAFTAGSHIDVRLGPGLSRPYSLCNDPGEDHRYLIAVLHEAQGRGGSKAMHALQPGDLLDIGVPKNNFPLVAGPQCSLLLAGGIGVTPIFAMAQTLARRVADFEMHYCTRSLARTAFARLLAAAQFAGRVHLHLDDGAAAQRLQLDAVLQAQPPGTHLYVCGPSGFMDAVNRAARAAGWPGAQLHQELFSAAPARLATDGSFTLRLARSGRLVEVARDVTVVQALAAAGVVVPTSCEQGVCGTCLTRVLDGVPEHRDMVLTPAEQATNTQFLPCCSRARTPVLVLDL